jgi:hypothetical protein
MTGNIFIISEVTVVALLGIPTVLYLFLAYRAKARPVEQLSESIANYGLFNSLYSVFLSMALVTLMVNFYTVQDDTSNEAEAIVSAMRLANGLSDAASLKLSLVAYAQSVVDYDLKAMQTGQMSAEASKAFDHLWDKAYGIKLTTKNDESIHRALIADLSEITKCRMARRIKFKDNLHPMIFLLIVSGYYVMLIKTYRTRLNNKKNQLYFELCMFVMVILVAIIIVDLNTPFIGLVNIDTAAFNWAFQRAVSISGLYP